MSRQHIAGRLLRSTGASVFSLGWRMTVTLGAELVLRRFIEPADWGLLRWSLVIFMVMGAVRDLGLAYHVLRVEPRPYGNLLRLEMFWGGALLVACLFGAPLGQLFYAEADPQLAWVLRGLAFFMFFEGLATVPRVYLEGELSIGRAVLPEILRNVCFVVVSISLALNGYGVWSLVIAHVSAAGLYALLLWRRVWGEIPLEVQPGKTLELVRDSLPLATIWFLVILTRYVDPLVLGLRFSSETVGQYTFAYDWATLVSIQILLPAIGRALYPALVKFRDSGKGLFSAFSLATLLIAAIEVPVALFLFLNADLVLRIVGGPQWTEAATYLRILCFAPLVEPMTRLGGEVLKTLHKDRWWIASAVVTVVSYAGGGFILTGIMGPVGMAWVNLAPLGAVVMAWALYRVAPKGFTQLIRDLAIIYVIPLPTFAAVYYFAGEQPVACFVASIAAAAVSVALVGKIFGKRFVEFFRPPAEPLAAEESSGVNA